MAITKSVIKLTHQEAFVKIINDTATAGPITIALATDLLKGDETLSGALDVRLSSVEYGLNANGGRIIRNGVNVLEMPAANHGLFTHDTCNDPTQKASDLVVTLGQGTVIIRLLKVTGYLPNNRPAQGVGT
jgi:hypothetical protein